MLSPLASARSPSIAENDRSDMPATLPSGHFESWSYGQMTSTSLAPPPCHPCVAGTELPWPAKKITIASPRWIAGLLSRWLVKQSSIADFVACASVSRAVSMMTLTGWGAAAVTVAEISAKTAG